jgi:hypothetical protein
MKIELELSSEQAEMLVFACALRARQNGVGFQATDAIVVGEQIALKAGKAFGWHQPEKMLARVLYPIKQVSIKCYETNPNPKP